MRHRAAAGWKKMVQLAAKAEGLPKVPLGRARVVCTRRSSAPPDQDNLAASFKPIIDAMKPQAGYRGVIQDDSPDYVTCEYHWERERSRQGIRIEVYEV